jgi:hypothetical protein
VETVNIRAFFRSTARMGRISSLSAEDLPQEPGYRFYGSPLLYQCDREFVTVEIFRVSRISLRPRRTAP